MSFYHEHTHTHITCMKREALELTSILWSCLALVSLEEEPVRSDSIRIIHTDTCV